ncbi:hypothetical protein [Asticcacaulis sp. EMRT-3]|uniref:hypothetical protein n=1 Tax=Asticcacaulis sp. EMRT-3 TaxID=3040349 RepID=UPI0024AFD829|nr:hypothetical protein [Asticcacaulis sp. EMRT-3]MDI7774501.1 hypothetical protein [Asticcacaulis sp. EMRT-3]
MTSHKYAFDLLFRHSNEVAINTRRALKQPVAEARKLFGFLGEHFQTIEREQSSLSRNVRLSLTTRFINHQFAELMLIERGLLLDAFNCSRAGLEATAFYWLVVKDSSAAEHYEAARSLKPVEVRKRLEALGIDITPLRDMYSFQSEVAHVGNKSDGLQIDWEKGASGRLLIGGGGDQTVQHAMLFGMVKNVFRFVKHDEAYIVPDLDERFPDF